MMDLHLPSLGTLALKADLAMCFMQKRTKFTVGLTQMEKLLLAFWFDHMHKQTNTHHIQTGIYRLTHKDIITSSVICTQQLSVLHWINHSLISKMYTWDQQYISFLKVITCGSHILTD